MKKYKLIILLITLISTLNAQNIFMIGSKSYPCTETFELQAKSGVSHANLEVLIAKDGDKAMLVLSRYAGSPVLIRGKAILYLDDGTVITCIDRGKYDVVDNIATTIFYLTTDELNKMKTSNLNTIRYTLKCGSGCTISTDEGDFSAINEATGGYRGKDKIDVPTLIKKLFN